MQERDATETIRTSASNRGLQDDLNSVPQEGSWVRTYEASSRWMTTPTSSASELLRNPPIHS